MTKWEAIGLQPRRVEVIEYEDGERLELTLEPLRRPPMKSGGVQMNDVEPKISGMSLTRLAILALVVAGCIAVVLIILPVMHIAVPAFVVQILWVVFCVVVGIAAIKFIVSLL